MAKQVQEFWSSEEGILIRLEDLAHDFTFKTYNKALKGYFVGSGFKRFKWISVLRVGHTCKYCWNQHNKEYRSGQFLPRIPAHVGCECMWDILMELS